MQAVKSMQILLVACRRPTGATDTTRSSAIKNANCNRDAAIATGLQFNRSTESQRWQSDFPSWLQMNRHRKLLPRPDRQRRHRKFELESVTAPPAQPTPATAHPLPTHQTNQAAASSHAKNWGIFSKPSIDEQRAIVVYVGKQPTLVTTIACPSRIHWDHQK